VEHAYEKKPWLAQSALTRRDRSSNAVGVTAMAGRLAGQADRLGLVANHSTSQQRSGVVAATIQELFPRIPEEDIGQIVERAFAEVRASRTRLLRFRLTVFPCRAPGVLVMHRA